MCKVEVLFGVEAEVVIEVEVKDFDTFSNLNFRFEKCVHFLFLYTERVRRIISRNQSKQHFSLHEGSKRATILRSLLRSLHLPS